ncbi:MAG: M15 family metallopeptidase [Gammaproteobacteria bacterium]|nr:M15 family metallopeptidase [Gammaproteobacteria bacterium]
MCEAIIRKGARGGVAAFFLALASGCAVIDDTNQHGRDRAPRDGASSIENETLQRVPVSAPRPAPERLLGLIGEYGPDQNVLYIYEQAGKLHALIERLTAYPLLEDSADVFRFPDWGLYNGERLIFRSDASGRVAQVEIGGGVFERRAVGPEGGGTFRITPQEPVVELRAQAVASEPPEEEGNFRAADLVDLTALDPTIKLDIRYATSDNFLSTPLYTQPRAFLQRPAAEAVARAHRVLAKYGYGLLIHDAYRPWWVTKVFWEATPADLRKFVADPADGSRHNRGCAVDLTLYDRRTGKAVEMPGVYDEMSDRSYPGYPGGTALQRWHRDLLRKVMEQEGFAVWQTEWWHFDYNDWKKYSILNLDFDELAGTPSWMQVARAPEKNP